MKDKKSGGSPAEPETVSLAKSEGPDAAAPADPAGVPAVEPSVVAPSVVQRPKQVGWAVIGLLVVGVAALVQGLSLFGLHSYLVSQLIKNNPKVGEKNHRSMAEILHTASVQPTSAVIQSALVLVVLAFVARAAWRGRYWARWASVGLWALATLTQIPGGLFGLTAIAAPAPIALKVPVFIASVVFVAVLVFTNMKPSVAYFNLTRPVRPAPGEAPARRGLFAPRDPVRATRQGFGPPPPAGTRKVRTAASRTDELFRGDSNTERVRSKQRANAEAVARGAELARARAKAGKSRRTGV